jgi:acetyl/propionyl-CoA carboxylase alpha subunit
MPITRLLIANRGEIAIRIARAAADMGLRSVAVHSRDDARSLHVRAADEVRELPGQGGAAYLDADVIIATAKASGCDAVHPGYGFLSERADFARRCAKAGLIFVGPSPEHLELFGDKARARMVAVAADVPVIRGIDRAVSLEEAQAFFASLGGGAMIIKAVAGGGGRGTRAVLNEAEIEPAWQRCRSEAEAAFGRSDVYVEQYIPRARHIEVQILGDLHGTVTHLGERECSIQRRFQKIIEVAPAPALDDDLRNRIIDAAVRFAKSVGYTNVGTFEFLVDATNQPGAQPFVFIETNARLQVEHTVTEAVTGLDLVEWQLRVAAGETLPLAQREVGFDGHAIEARICAEDPERGFLPSAGKLQVLEWPHLQSVRVDAGFASGDTVPDCYDSLLGKIIAWAPTREQAAARLAAALTQTLSAGVHTNERWLRRILRSPRFLEVRHTIALLDESAAEFAGPRSAAPEVLILAALALHGETGGRAGSPWDLADGFTPNLPALVAYGFSWRGHTHTVELEYVHGKPAAVTVDAGARRPLSDALCGGAVVAARIDERRRQARYHLDGARVDLWTADEHYDLALEDPRTREFSASAATGSLTTPLPGVVVLVPVAVGQKVAAGDVLMVIEAMKMEHTITAPYAGRVEVIHFARGERVPEASELLELVREPATAP